MKSKKAEIQKTQAATLAVMAEAMKPDFIRRLQKKHGPGKGDYTKDRHKVLNQLTNDDIEKGLREIASKRKKSS